MKPTLGDPKEILKNALDPNKVQLVCEVHNYVAGGQRRHTGCSKCIFVDFVAMVARSKNPLEDFDKLEALVHAMVELDDKGELNINLNRTPTITVEHQEDDECLIH